MNDGPEKKEPNKDVKEEKKTDPSQQGSKQPNKDASAPNIDDLKAKLGLTTKPKKTKKPKAPEKKPAQEPEKKISQEIKPVQQAPQPQVYDNIPLDDEALEAIKSGKLRWSVVVLIVGLVALLIGVLFGKIMRDRKIDNRRTEEARFILHYLEHARGSRLTETTILEAVDDFNKKLHDLSSAFAKATDPMKQQAVRNSLKLFMKDAKKFVDKAAYFSMDSAFPNVIYNQKVAFKVVQFINDVKEFNRLAALVAKEGAILNRLKPPDPTKKEYRYVEIEPITENGFKLNKGTWIEAMNWKNVSKDRQGKLIAVKPLGAKEGYLLHTTSLVKLDISPIDRAKASIYEKLIYLKVIGLFQQLKLQGDKLDFPSLKKELQHYANREMLFTIF